MSNPVCHFQVLCPRDHPTRDRALPATELCVQVIIGRGRGGWRGGHVPRVGPHPVRESAEPRLVHCEQTSQQELLVSKVPYFC